MIDIESTIKIAVRALKINKMRSALTSLGIIIGVAAVIIMLSIGAGASKQISEQISSMGSNLLIVLSGATTAGGIRMGSGTQPTLTSMDAEAISQNCPSIAAVSPLFGSVAQVSFSNQNWSTQVSGVMPDYLYIRDWKIQSGRSFYLEDVENATKVCLLGQTVVENLFGDLDPVGQVVRIKGIPFTVIGILEVKGQSQGNQDQDDTIIVPLKTAQKKLFGTPFPDMVRVIMVKARTNDLLDNAQDEITELLRERHRIGPKDEDDFTVRNLTQTMETAKQSSNVMSFLLGAIASVSLLVGGIGIMNIMLVSVMERTKEIGIRMAIGAKKWDIRMQFLAEALILSMLGGFVGIFIGCIGAKMISALAGWPVVISVSSILLSFGFAVFIGIFFGFYPAYKASNLNPIEALRYE